MHGVTRQNNKNRNNFEEELPIPPDGGWGWAVVIASFLIHIITDGITYSFGVIYVQLLAEFNEGKGYTSWILSLMTGVTFCTGPISSSLVNKFGCRAVTIAGSLLASICLLISAYAQNVLTLIITIGFGLGHALGLIYLPAIVCVSMYFEKHRSLATGIAVAGSGLGTSIFAPLIAYFVEIFEWRGTLVALSIIVLHCGVFGALFRPLTSTTQPITPVEYNDSYQRDEPFEVAPVQNGNTISKAQNGSMSNGMSDENETKPLITTPKRWNSGSLSRPDIFYRASLQSISNHGSNNELLSNEEKYGSIKQIDYDYEDSFSDDGNDGCIPNETRECFLKMTNLNLLKNPVYALFVLANFIANLGFYVPYFYLPDRVKELDDMSDEHMSTMLAIIGFTNTLGRVVFGYITDKKWANRLWVYNICLFSCGIATIASIMCSDFLSLAIYSGTFGITISGYVSLTSVILVDLLGLDKLTNAFGLLLLFQGISSFLGPPIIGFLHDEFGSYTPGFVFAGMVFIMSGFSVLFIPKTQRTARQRRITQTETENLTIA